MNIFITNKKKLLENILKNFIKNFENFNIKNLNIENLYNLKIKINKNINFLRDICEIKILKDRFFLLIFNDIEKMKIILKNNYFENFGFNIKKKKNNIELIIPELSLEFRNNILNILKKEYIICKEIIENNRKKFFLEIKKFFKSKDTINYLEKNIELEINKIKEKISIFFEKKKKTILND